MTHEPYEESEDLRRVACVVRRMSDVEPPADFMASVMGAVRSRKLPWWVRAYRWSKVPKSLTFTPLRLATAVVLLLITGVATFQLFPERDPWHLTQAEAPGAVTVELVLNMPEARSVSVVGSFNNWNPQEGRMHPSQSTWTLTLTLPSGRYEYALVVDGSRIVPDPHAQFYQDDGFGQRNSVLIVGSQNETAI